jgi:hypothetical protein
MFEVWDIFGAYWTNEREQVNQTLRRLHQSIALLARFHLSQVSCHLLEWSSSNTRFCDFVGRGSILGNFVGHGRKNIDSYVKTHYLTDVDIHTALSGIFPSICIRNKGAP